MQSVFYRCDDALMFVLADQAQPEVSTLFGAFADIAYFDASALPPKEAIHADILIIRSKTTLKPGSSWAHVVEHPQSRVKLVGSCVAGIDHIDPSWLKQNNVQCFTAAGCNAQSVCEYTLGAVAYFQNKALVNFSKQPTAAIIGVGHVGQRVANALTHWGFKVMTCDPYRANEPNFKHTPLEQINEVDLICLHSALSDTGCHPSYGMITNAWLKQQRPNTLVINAARGELLADQAWSDQNHLIWVNDCWSSEPNIPHDLLAMSAIATPHIAGHSQQAKRRGLALVYQQIAAIKKWPVSQDILDLCQPNFLSVEQLNHSAFKQHLAQQHQFETLTQQLKQHPELFGAMRKKFSKTEQVR